MERKPEASVKWVLLKLKFEKMRFGVPKVKFGVPGLHSPLFDTFKILQ